MRRTLGFLVLAAVLAAAGCGASNTPNANSPGTTTYGNSNTASGAGQPATTGAAPSSNANSDRPGEGGIKPPTSK